MTSARMYMASKLKEFRKARDLTVDEVGEAVGKSGKTVSAWEVGRGQPEADILVLLCKLYNVQIDDFYDVKSYRPEPANCFRPIYGRIPAGTPLEAIETPGETAWCDPDTAEAYPLGFFLTVSGDSMDLVYRPGGRVFVNPGEREIVSGKNYVVLVNGSDATLKQVFRAGDTIVLHPRSTNPAHKDISIDVTDPDAPYFSVVGKVVQYIGARE